MENSIESTPIRHSAVAARGQYAQRPKAATPLRALMHAEVQRAREYKQQAVKYSLRAIAAARAAPRSVRGQTPEFPKTGE